MGDEAMSLFKFLNVTNSKRYRLILHFFYMEHQQTNYLLKKNDVWEYMVRKYPENYTEDELILDLKRLWDYGNLNVINEQAKKRKLDDFYSNDYTYSIESRTVDIVELSEEIEQRVDELIGELNGNNLRDIRTLLERMPKLLDSASIYKNYMDLKRIFQENNDNTVNYFGYLNKEITKGVLQSESFIETKVSFLVYLKDYVLELEKQRSKIWLALKNIDDETKLNISDARIKHRKEIASFSLKSINEIDFNNQVFDQFNNIKIWFSNQENSMYNKIYNQAEQMIQIFSNADVQYFNRHKMQRNRQSDFRKIAEWMYQAGDVNEAAKMFVSIFGMMNMKHLNSSEQYAYDSDKFISLWETQPELIDLQSRNKGGTITKKVQVTKGYSADRKKLREALIADEAHQKERILSYFKEGTLKLSDDIQMEEELRRIIRQWISSGITHKDHITNTAFGFKILVELDETTKIRIYSEDGTLTMPGVTLKIINYKKEEL
ncbi:TIGR02677 family protein [Enterococcus sp. LJL98]